MPSPKTPVILFPFLTTIFEETGKYVLIPAKPELSRLCIVACCRHHTYHMIPSLLSTLVVSLGSSTPFGIIFFESCGSRGRISRRDATWAFLPFGVWGLMFIAPLQVNLAKLFRAAVSLLYFELTTFLAVVHAMVFAFLGHVAACTLEIESFFVTVYSLTLKGGTFF
jgi:hypothetical protein